ncbi:MAG TPA: PTS sugar transporter subunit IIC, partial [Candidatus Ozemobacteraceae bacterium]|nr:PTS sugar transporter subunit IIC [Candidatus Ozemobacteraceae bacterium]
CNTVALLVAVALGLFGRALDRGIRRLNTRLESWVSLRLQSGTSWALAAGHTLGGVLTFGKAFLFCFFVTWLGVEPLRAFTRSLSFGQNTGFIVIQGLLPAVGFAVLAGMCIQSQRELRWFLGGVILFTILPTSVWIGWIVAGIAAIRILWTQNDAA